VHLAWALHNDGNPEGGRRLFNVVVVPIAIGSMAKARASALTSRASGANYNREQMIDSLLYPSKQVLVGYQQTVIVTKDDEVQTGVIRKEDDQEVVLLDSASQSHTIKTSAIKERSDGAISLVMPDGLFETWSREEFGDLDDLSEWTEKAAANR
jgi:putative heme-binding domain-containing protein